MAALLPIRRFPDPLLKQPTQPVARIDEPVKRLIESMIQTMCHHPHCVGLAAPQVGSALRIAVMDSSRYPKTTNSLGLIILVNPQIESAEEITVKREGCLSVPDLTANVRRAVLVRVRATNQFGSTRLLTLEGFEAIIAQHEIDHLDGKLFLDRVANLKTDVFQRTTYR